MMDDARLCVDPSLIPPTNGYKQRMMIGITEMNLPNDPTRHVQKTSPAAFTDG